MLDIDNFLGEAKAALGESDPRRAVRELVERTVSDPTAVGDALQPRKGGFDILHRSEDLTVINFAWSPNMRLYPHDHRMWAVIGIYAGREDNAFFRRTQDGIAPSGGKELREGDVLTLGSDAIHAVANPLGRITAAIHIYGGDFVTKPRSQWGPGPLEEQPFDLDLARQQFAEANAAAGLC